MWNASGSRGTPTELVLLALLSGCGCIASVPIPREDRAPTVSVTGLVADGSNAPQETVSSDTTIRIPPGTKIMAVAAAKNSGGVQSLSIAVRRGVQTLYTAATSATPGPTGLVPEVLSIAGTDGAGGPGGQGMFFDMPATGAVTIFATAQSFHGHAASVMLTYVTDCGCRPDLVPDVHCNCECPIERQCPAKSGDGSCCASYQQCCDGRCVDLEAGCVTHGCVDPGDVPCDAAHGGDCCSVGFTCCSPVWCCPAGFGLSSENLGPASPAQLVPHHKAGDPK